MNSLVSHKPFVVALAGGSGSGKTTLSRIITDQLPWPAVRLGLDWFYKDLSDLPVDERKTFNFDHPDSMDVPLIRKVLIDLIEGRETEAPKYDFEQYNRTTKTIPLTPAPVIVVEGMFALYFLELMDLFDLTVFLNIDEQTRWERKLERDIRDRGRDYDTTKAMWDNFTRPMHKEFVQPTSGRAKMVFTDSFAPRVVDAITQEILDRVAMQDNSATLQ